MVLVSLVQLVALELQDQEEPLVCRVPAVQLDALEALDGQVQQVEQEHLEPLDYQEEQAELVPLDGQVRLVREVSLDL